MEKIIEWIKAAFEFLGQAFEKLVKELIERPEIKQFMADAGQIIKDEVLKADELDLPGKEKHKIAFENIETALKASGKEFSVFLINWGIETVLASIRTGLDKKLNKA